MSAIADKPTLNAAVPRKPLLEAVKRLRAFARPEKHNPGSGTVRMVFDPQGVNLSAYNSDVTYRTRVTGDANEAAEFALPGELLATVLSASTSDTIDFTLELPEVELKGGSTITRLQTVDLAQVASVELPDALPYTLPGKALKDAIDAIAFAAATAEYQATFRGIHFEAGTESTRLVATDGFRLCHYDIAAPAGLEATSAFTMLVNAKLAVDLARLLPDDEVAFGFDAVGATLNLRWGDSAASARLMSGTFPDYRRVIPKTFVMQVVVDATAMSQLLARVLVMADADANNRVDLHLEDTTLVATARNAYGQAQETLELEPEGPERTLELAYNGRFLLDLLRNIDGKARLSFSGATTPTVITPLEPSGYVAMGVPLKVGNPD